MTPTRMQPKQLLQQKQSQCFGALWVVGWLDGETVREYGITALRQYSGAVVRFMFI